MCTIPSGIPSPRSFDRNYIFKRDFPDILPVAFKIHKLTNIPFLLPDDYAFIFKALASGHQQRGRFHPHREHRARHVL